MAVIQGFTRLRAAQLGKQSVFGTPVNATRRLPWRGVPEINPNLTDPDVDTGELDLVIPPYITAPEYTWAPEGLLTFDDLPNRWAAQKGGVTPTLAGTVATWAYQLLSSTADSFDYQTLDYGDDTSASDGFELSDGVAESLSEEMPEDLGPWTMSDSWVFASAALATDRTAGLTTDTAPVYVEGGDTLFKMDSNAAAIGNTLLLDAVHSASLTITNNLDLKRFANGSNSKYKLSGYGRGPRVIELSLTLAKTTATMAEAATLMNSIRPKRYFEVHTVATSGAGVPVVIPGSATAYSYRRRMAARLYSRSDGEIGGNTTITLVYRAFKDTTLGYALRADIINARTTL